MKAIYLYHRIKPNNKFHFDITWWFQYLPSWNGVSLLYNTQGLTSMNYKCFTDASHLSYDCYFQGHCCQVMLSKVNFKHKLMSINWRELHRMTMALAIWGLHFCDKRIFIHGDNSSVVQIIIKCPSRSKSMVVLVHSLVMLGMKHSFDIQLLHISRVDNTVADALLRFRNEEFWKLTPDADIEMMPPATFQYM